MSGMANEGLAQGFMQGYSFVNGIHQQQKQEQRQQQQDQWQQQVEQHQQQDWQRADNQRLVKAFYQGVSSGKVNPQIADEFSNRFGVDLSQYDNPHFGQSLHTLEGAVNGSVSYKSPQFLQAFQTVFNPDINRNTGETYQAPDGTTHQVVAKRVAGVYPGPDGKTLMVDLNVLDRGPKGEQWRTAPVTDNRSATDQTVKAIPLEQALQKLKGHQLIYNAVQSSPQLKAMVQQYATRVGATLPQSYGAPEQVPGLGMVQVGPDGKINQLKSTTADHYGTPYKDKNLGWVQQGPNGKLIQLKDPFSGAGSTSLIKNTNWMVRTGIAKNRSDAYQMLSAGRKDPASLVLHIVDQGIKAQQDQGIYPTLASGKPNPDYKTPAQLRENAVQALQSIYANMRPSGAASTQPAAAPAAPQGLQLQGATTQALPADGSAVQNPDGSYSGRINRSPQAPAPAPQTAQQKAAAIQYLHQHPELKGQFLAKYGYLPKGFQ